MAGNLQRERPSRRRAVALRVALTLGLLTATGCRLPIGSGKNSALPGGFDASSFAGSRNLERDWNLHPVPTRPVFGPSGMAFSIEQPSSDFDILPESRERPPEPELLEPPEPEMLPTPMEPAGPPTVSDVVG